MAVNRVDINGATVIDLTGDSVTPETLLQGATAHDASGAAITGTMVRGTKLQIIVTVESGATVTATKGSLSVSGTSVNGTCTLTVPEAGTWSVTATLNETVSIPKSVSVVDSYAMTLVLVSPVLDNNTWNDIQFASDSGQGANCWSIGDCKEVTVSGTVGTQAINGTYYAYIIGFDHNSSNEGNGITFGAFKTAATGGKDICFIDSKYQNGATDGTKYFNMQHANKSWSIGWANCDLRYDVLGSTNTNGKNATATTATKPVANTLMAALPSDLRAVMKPMNIYTSNHGGSDRQSDVTKTVDYLPLLAEFEVFGSQKYANQYEKNHQAQYAYYSAGNPKKKYRHSSPDRPAQWWLRSPYRYSSNVARFIWVQESGSENFIDSVVSLGITVAFRV